MEQALYLSNRFREVMLNGTWIANTNFKDQLAGTSWIIATTKAGELNTIAALTQHIHYYIGGLLKEFAGGPLDINDRYSFDFAPLTSQQEWDTILERLWRDAEQFALLTAQLSDEQLQGVFVDPKYGTYQRNIEGMIEHCYYHLGQLVLIKKIITASQTL